MANTDCLIGIVGVTRQDCECVEGQLQEPAEGETPADTDWYKQSKSGFYVHELDGVVSIEAVKDVVYCENLPGFYKRIIASSIVETADDISASVNERYTKKESNYVGFIGSRTSSKVLPLVAGYAAMKIAVADLTAGVLVIKGISTLMNETIDFDIEVWRRYVETDQHELVDTIEGAHAVAGILTENPFEEKLILPMQIENEGLMEYYFMYSTANGLLPRNNQASCGCGNKERRLRNMINYSGVSGTVQDAMGVWPETENANGLVLDAEIRCDAESIICKMYESNMEWAKYVAHAVLFKAAWKLHKAILSSTNITQEIMANREGVNDNMIGFDTEYWSRIRYLVQNIDLKLNDCYTCNGKRLKVTQILL